MIIQVFFVIKIIGGGVEIFEYISSCYGVKKFDLGFVTPYQNSFISLLLENLSNSNWIIQKKETFNVILPYNYLTFDDYFKTLSKSTRQNYRTAINRLNKDERTFSFKFYENVIPKDEIKKFLSDHEKRLKIRYLKNRSVLVEKALSPFRRLIYGKYRRDEIAALSMENGNRQILAVMTIDGKNAAYYYGLISESDIGSKRINFFRVCVNDEDFGFYSPGMVLGIELIKKYQNEFAIYDFTKGDEEYKYKLGCQNETDFIITIRRK